MSYEERKAAEIIKLCSSFDIRQKTHEKVLLIIKEIIKDTRHKAAENVVNYNNLNRDGFDVIKVNDAHRVIMNTNLE